MQHSTHKLLAVAALALSVATASAQTATWQGRKTAPVKQTTTLTAQPAPRLVPVNRAAISPADYGTEVTVMTEDFSKMTNGSIDKPATGENINYDNPDNAWINMTDSYTQTPGWGSHNAYPAGGCIYLKADKRNQAQLNTPMLDASGYQGIVFLQFKARTPQEGQKAYDTSVEAAETYNMSPSWDFLGSARIPVITSEWQTYEFMYYGAGGYTLFNIVADGAPIVIDDVKVYQVDQYTGTPTAYPHRYYHGTDFNLRWSQVTGADDYLLNVYTADEDGDPADYLVQDQAVSDTTYTVTGATSGETYYYTVRSHKGNHESFPTKAVRVLDVAAPTLKPVEALTDGSYEAAWSEVPSAERYNYIAYHKRQASEAGDFVVTDLDFTGVRAPVPAPNDTLTGWTIENPSFNTWSEAYIDNVSQAGWKGTNYAPYTDYICLDAYHYVYNHSDSGLISPELDLSKNGGKFDLSVDLYGAYYDGGLAGSGYTQCAVALFNYNAETDGYEQAELVYPRDVKNAWQTYQLELTKGTARSIVGIYAITYPENLYVDNVKITQHYEAGDYLLDPFYFGRWIDGTSVHVPVAKALNGQDLYHRVNAERVVESDGWSVKRKEGAWSELDYVGKGISVGIDQAQASYATARVKVEGGHIVVANPQGAAVEVYTLEGKLVHADYSGHATVTTPVLPGATYVVKAGHQSVKVTF